MPRHLEFLEGCALCMPEALSPPSLATNSIKQKLFFSLSLWFKNHLVVPLIINLVLTILFSTLSMGMVPST